VKGIRKFDALFEMLFWVSSLVAIIGFVMTAWGVWIPSNQIIASAALFAASFAAKHEAQAIFRRHQVPPDV
jgi:hypothetical protein